MGKYNPRNSMPNNVSNFGYNKNNYGPMPPMGTQPFVNNPNQFVPMQNNQMGFPMSAPVMFPGQAFPGFLPQFNGLSMNNGPMFPTSGSFRPDMNQMNLSQTAAQFQNMQNFPQLMNQGQLGMQNMNQFYAMQMAALAQLGSFNIPVSNQMIGSLNQGNPYSDPQNQAFVGTPSYGTSCSDDGRGNQINLTQSSVEQKELPNTPDILESDSFPPGFYHPPSEGQALATLQPGQGNFVSNGQSNMQNSVNNNFRDRPNNGRWENPKFMSAKNGKRKFDGPRDNGSRGGFNGKQRNNNNSTLSYQESPEPKRLSVSYTEQEIQQWRDQRRKHHPSRANKDELHKENITGDERIERAEKLRREQLKQILAKQAELGVEVADIPSHYLTDSEKQEDKTNETDFNTKENFRNKHNKQRRNNNRNKFAKRQHSTNNESSSNAPSSSNREPSLLQKLLSTDIKKDKQHLLQVFRFMVMNNLLKDHGMDKPLEYPIALVKEPGYEVATFKDELQLDTSASQPGILTNDEFSVQDCDMASAGGSNVGNWNCGEEVISAVEEGEILC